MELPNMDESLRVSLREQQQRQLCASCAPTMAPTCVRSASSSPSPLSVRSACPAPLYIEGSVSFRRTGVSDTQECAKGFVKLEPNTTRLVKVCRSFAVREKFSQSFRQ